MKISKSAMNVGYVAEGQYKGRNLSAFGLDRMEAFISYIDAMKGVILNRAPVKLSIVK